MEALQRGLERLPRGPSQLRGEALTRLVALYVAQFDLENAQRYAQMAVENSRHLHDVWHQQSVLAMLGNIKHFACDWQGAIPEYKGALAIAWEIGDRTVHAAMEVNLGIVHANLGNVHPAMEYLQRGLELSRQSNLRSHELKAQLALAKLSMRLGECSAVAHYLDAAEELVERVGSADAHFHLPLILSARAEMYFTQGQLGEALLLAEESVTMAIEQEKQVDRAVCQRVLAQVLAAQGDGRRAIELLEESLSLLAGRHGYEAAKIKVLLAHCLSESGDPARGEALISDARQSFEKYGAKFDLAEVTPLQN
jgi:tetratricopeptide (TPR) repeat protein